MLRLALGLVALCAAGQALAVDVVELPGRVVPDPRRVQHVSAMQAGVVQAPASGFALPGDSVPAGAQLAVLQPQLTAPERRDLGVELAAAERDTEIGKLQLQRFKIEAAETFDIALPTPTALLVADYRTAEGKRRALDGGLNTQSNLQAPEAAQLLRSRAVQGGSATEGTVLFELLRPGALAVEAVFTDGDLDPAAAREALTLGGERLPVQLLAQSYDPSLRSHRALFVLAADAPVAVQQPLLVQVPRRAAGGP